MPENHLVGKTNCSCFELKSSNEINFDTSYSPDLAPLDHDFLPKQKYLKRKVSSSVAENSILKYKLQKASIQARI
jgi:hypothetical protein